MDGWCLPMSLTPEDAAKTLRDQAELICRQNLFNHYLTPRAITAAWDEYERACLLELQQLLAAQ
jgi:hypothetical protein